MTPISLVRQGALVLALVALLAPAPGVAQTDASALSVLSALPLASIAASEAGAAASQASAQVLVAGANLVVRSVASTARGTVYVLERLSDGVRVSVEVTTWAAGLILAAAGEAIAFIPNEVGRALLYNKRLTN